MAGSCSREKRELEAVGTLHPPLLSQYHDSALMWGVGANINHAPNKSTALLFANWMLFDPLPLWIIAGCLLCFCTFVRGQSNTAREVAPCSHFSGARWTARWQRTPSELYNADYCTAKQPVLGDVPLHCAVSPLLSSHLVLITRAHSLLEAESMHFTIQSHHFFLKPTTEHNIMCRIEGNKSTVWSNKMQDGAVSTRSPVDEFKHFMSSIYTLAVTVLSLFMLI